MTKSLMPLMMILNRSFSGKWPQMHNSMWSVYSRNGMYSLLNVNNRNTTAICKIYSKLTTETPEQRQWNRFVVILNTFLKINFPVLFYRQIYTSQSHFPGNNTREIRFFLVNKYFFGKQVLPKLFCKQK